MLNVLNVKIKNTHELETQVSYFHNFSCGFPVKILG